MDEEELDRILDGHDDNQLELPFTDSADEMRFMYLTGGTGE